MTEPQLPKNPLLAYALEHPHIVTQLVAFAVSMLVSYGVLTLSPASADALAGDVTVVIFGIFQVVGAVVGQNWTVPEYRAAAYGETA